MFVLDTKRRFKQTIKITIVDEDGKSHNGSFSAIFQVLPTNEITDLPSDDKALDHVLKEVHDIELENNPDASQEELMSALKNDPTVSHELLKAYYNGLQKKT